MEAAKGGEHDATAVVRASTHARRCTGTELFGSHIELDEVGPS